MNGREYNQADTIEIQNRFIERADKLHSSSLMKAIEGEGGLRFILTSNLEAKELLFDYANQNSEQVDAFLFTLRLFIDNKDSISIGKVGDLIDSLDIDKEPKERYTNQRKILNTYLDEKSMIIIDGDNPTNGDILRTLLYGYLGHFNVEQAKYGRYKAWTLQPDIKSFLEILFISILITIVENLKVFSNCCQHIVKELSARPNRIVS